ncbi:transmembrane amino acid transporter protein-domain-containing protein [Roridomyces roridus]|uniref:Transmembrane amino acid transporter protein-domain-containing protein n=1 Tax=Roridomyces roridus TaxID=1738132 RepID=A0AAD7FDH1_9AGAR|nr:transmembrane amino acid transporter protein-domain-containing protein [Roridomyces roridus]
MASPSKPVNISKRAEDGAESVSGSGTPYGTPDIRALRAQYAGNTPPPNIPPRNIPTPSLRPTDSNPSLGQPGSFKPGSFKPGSFTGSGIGAFRTETPPNPDLLDDLPDEEKARVLRRHLVSKGERELDVPQQSGSRPSNSRRSSSGAQARADVTHDIYKWHSDQRKQAARPRAASFTAPSPVQNPAFEHIHEPGGFRRNYVLVRAAERGEEEPPILNNFIEFLYIFGHFAGEDLEEDEEDDDEETAVGGDGVGDLGENAPLLAPRTALLKSFVGTGVLFLGKAFYNGGILFSSVLFIFIALISLYSFLLLVEAKFVVSGSFGDIGGTLYGPWMRYLILGSIIVSQLGFVSAYIIFVAQNLQALVMGITHCLYSDASGFVYVHRSLLRFGDNRIRLSGTEFTSDLRFLVGFSLMLTGETVPSDGVGTSSRNAVDAVLSSSAASSSPSPSKKEKKRVLSMLALESGNDI